MSMPLCDRCSCSSSLEAPEDPLLLPLFYYFLTGRLGSTSTSSIPGLSCHSALTKGGWHMQNPLVVGYLHRIGNPLRWGNSKMAQAQLPALYCVQLSNGKLKLIAWVNGRHAVAPSGKSSLHPPHLSTSL